eukprot:NODE_219_length_12440_cov_2.445588.p6 type:complete len:228 gc:universal NODE_219_length_12440_cov_2.445588:11753-12436(+)
MNFNSYINESAKYMLPASSEYWTEKQVFFNSQVQLEINSKYFGAIVNENYGLVYGLTLHKSSHYDHYINAFCLYKLGNADGCAKELEELLPKIPTNQKVFLSAIHYYLGVCYISTPKLKLYVLQSFELWCGNYDAFDYLLRYDIIPSQEKTNLAHIISQINNDIIKDLYWCRLASCGPVMLEISNLNMLEDEDDPMDSDYTPSTTSYTQTNGNSEVPITLTEVLEYC